VRDVSALRTPDHTRSAPRRVGHKGADALVSGNTPESFDAALAAGVQEIEFDVLSERPDGSGRLLLAHDYEAAAATEPIELADGLAHLAGPAFASVRLDVDLKLPGYELAVLDALRTFGLVERSLVSSTFVQSLDAVRAVAPEVRLGWSVPRARRDYTAGWLTRLPALAVLAVWRRRLPGRARRELAAGRFDAVMAHWRLVSPALVAAVRAGGGELYAWTVDDAGRIAELSRLGVDAIITNDPWLFG
jgi:glycerophosphoryl diester phosphodiesterase